MAWSLPLAHSRFSIFMTTLLTVFLILKQLLRQNNFGVTLDSSLSHPMSHPSATPIGLSFKIYSESHLSPHNHPGPAITASHPVSCNSLSLTLYDLYFLPGFQTILSKPKSGHAPPLLRTHQWVLVLGRVKASVLTAARKALRHMPVSAAPLTSLLLLSLSLRAMRAFVVP